ncbi:MAG: transcriptional regulator, AraC family [Ferruginibacter sp.]|nr:transcriptional regulator, AraC family [Ferruginibacter sp.]
MKLFIRNMACNSCKIVVAEALKKQGVEPVKVDLGEAELPKNLKPEQLKAFNSDIKKAGLELIENKEGILLEKIKKEILDYVYHSDKKMPRNFSRYLSKQLNYSYAYLANFFSSMQASTIEQYIISLKIEKAKELLMFKELTLTEIADKLNYSSVSHLSSQFKKVTGLTPSHFKTLKAKRRIVLQEL